MWLERLRLSAFRAFGEAEVTFGPVGLTLIAGANNSGKSAILAAIDTLTLSYPPSPVANTACQGPALVEATFVVDGDLRGNVLAGATTERAEGHAFRRLRATLGWTADGMPVWRELAATLDDGAWGAFGALEVDADGQLLRVADLARWAQDAPHGSPFALTDRARGGSMGERLLGETGSLGAVPLALRDWGRSVHHFGAVRGGFERRRPSHGDARLARTGENLPQVLLRLFTAQSPQWTAVGDVMADLVPDAGTPSTPVDRDEVEVAFTDASGVRRNLQDLGSGVQQLLLMAVVGETHVPDGPVLIEEPETSLHPGAQRALLRHLERWAETRQIIATTHSSPVLDRASEATSIWLVERCGAVSAVRQVSRDRGLLDELGVRLSDVFAAERLLVVEGSSDVAVFEAWWGTELRAARTQVVEAGGGDASRRADWYGAVANAGHALVRSVLFIRDRDELSDQAAMTLERGGLVHVLEVREIENHFLTAPDAVAGALSQVSGDGPVTAASVSSELALLEPAFEPLVVARRVVARIAPVRTLTWEQMSALSRSPDLVTLRSFIESNLDNAEAALLELDGTWATEAAWVSERWGQEWQRLVPGGELLERLWASHGARYDKRRDGPRVAAAMDPPKALGERINAFLAGTRSAR